MSPHKVVGQENERLVVEENGLLDKVFNSCLFVEEDRRCAGWGLNGINGGVLTCVDKNRTMGAAE